MNNRVMDYTQVAAALIGIKEKCKEAGHIVSFDYIPQYGLEGVDYPPVVYQLFLGEEPPPYDFGSRTEGLWMTFECNALCTGGHVISLADPGFFDRAVEIVQRHLKSRYPARTGYKWLVGKVRGFFGCAS